MVRRHSIDTPVEQPKQLTPSVHLRAIISNLYMLIVQAHDYQGQGTQQAMTNEMYTHR